MKYDSPDFDMLNKLSYNAGTFAAFKNHNQIQDTVKLLKDDSGRLIPKRKFVSQAKELNKKYNSRWLATEYDQSVSAARASKRWADVERTKDLYPNLTYVAVNDDRTRERHKRWNGITLPIEHPFWNTHTPPNDWGCRCTIRRTQNQANDQGFEVETPVKNKAGFNINFGKQGKVFDDTHPYYQVSAYKTVAKEANRALLNYQTNKLMQLNFKGKVSNAGLAIVIDRNGADLFIKSKTANTYEKNNLAYDLKNVVSQATYNGSAKGKGAIKMKHFFRVKDKELFIIIHEGQDGSFTIGGAADQMPTN